MIEALRECQEAFPKNKGTGQGFLSGYLEEQFDLLDSEIARYPQIWAPYYTLHKFIRRPSGTAMNYWGIRWRLRSPKIWEDWTCRRLSRLPKDQRKPDVEHVYRRRVRRYE